MHAFDVILKLKVDMLQPFSKDVASVLLQFVRQNVVPKGLTALISSAPRRMDNWSKCLCNMLMRSKIVSRLALGLPNSSEVQA